LSATTKGERTNGFGLTITEQVPLVVRPTEHNRRYLRSKVHRLGHALAPANGCGSHTLAVTTPTEQG
jgi:hypothetical protein